MSENHYEELGVETGASRDEIRDAHWARVADLEAAREKKGVTEAQLQQNREAVARVRKAWNVLSDPYQRGRYDQRIAAPTAADVELIDDDDETAGGAEVELTGWRKFMAPPPPRQTGTKNGKKPPTGGRPRPEPTIVLPDGLQLAEPRARGMALLFDLAVLAVLFFGVNFVVPGVIQSDYSHIQKQITKVNDLHDARVSIDDAQSSLAKAKTKSATTSATKDLKSAQTAFTKAENAAKKEGVPVVVPDSVASLQKQSDQPTAKALQTQANKLSDKVKTTGYIASLITLILALLYLVPVTARTGRTFGMRSRHVKVVRIDGSPVGWYASFTRFLIPLLFAVAIPVVGAAIGFAIVGWAYFDKNRQGIHDKLARTVVVDA
jgi:RDD family